MIQSAAVAEEAAPGRQEAEVADALVADEGDAAVTELHQVLGREPAALDVVDDGARNARRLAVDHGQGQAAVPERGQVNARQLQRHDDGSVGLLAGRQRRKMAVTLAGSLDVPHDGVEAVLVQHADRAGEPGNHGGPGQERYKDDDGPGAASR